MTKAKGDQKAQRAATREANVRSGLQTLAQWLRDLVRSGLGAESVRRLETWEAIAKLLQDAQAGGVAHQLRAIGAMLQSEPDWSPRLLEALGRLHLLVEGYARLEALSPGQQADLRRAIGFTERKTDVLTQSGVHDLWLALGRHTEIDESEWLTVQRTWLLGMRTGKMALLLDYEPYSRMDSIDRSFPPATWLETECVYYPSAYPLRVVARSRESEEAALKGLPQAQPSLRAALGAYAAALSANPWLERFPMLIAQLVPFYENGALMLVDSNGDAMRLTALEPMCLARLLAISGGTPITLFGEYDGRTFLPLSAFANERLITL
ncbi:MAG: hypothetical protein CUN49_06980 [Candidatus Thermofonsia Clade 1 bacterium]|uniref:SWIM zinc finger family protein n=1 Tax=Candidatus Thermofonsia Clade 1 bacterium TaxID=2364210 RepID=A0A2M8PF04_9CHLR|nr:MAG: hypothetical protein CUN49_06980 [Candidatus Thermofonsia Clade 1 bacterium]RMF51790.1 MAG: hypothetical protein D6749_06795 [Chloroflexota bacterium]